MQPINHISRSLGGINLVKSLSDAPVDANIFEILLVDGQRGWPALDQRLLLLNVVGSKPLHFASPEQDILCSRAKLSIARQTSSCVIVLISYGYPCFPIPHYDIINVSYRDGY